MSEKSIVGVVECVPEKVEYPPGITEDYNERYRTNEPIGVEICDCFVDPSIKYCCNEYLHSNFSEIKNGLVFNVLDIFSFIMIQHNLKDYLEFHKVDDIENKIKNYCQSMEFNGSFKREENQCWSVDFRMSNKRRA